MPFAIFHSQETLARSAAEALQVVLNCVTQTILKVSSVYDHLIDPVELLPLGCFADTHLSLLFDGLLHVCDDLSFPSSQCKVFHFLTLPYCSGTLFSIFLFQVIPKPVG